MVRVRLARLTTFFKASDVANLLLVGNEVACIFFAAIILLNFLYVSNAKLYNAAAGKSA